MACKPPALTAPQIHTTIALLTQNLISITDTSGEFLLRLPDGRVIDTKGWNDWEWTHGIGLYGLYQYHTLTASASTLTIIRDWFTTQLAKGTTKNINTMSPFLTLAYLYEETREKQYEPYLDAWAEWAMYSLPRTRFGGFQHITYDSTNHNELWDDTLMMTVLPLAKIGLVLKRPQYVEEAKRQFLIHVQFLFDTGTGLFFHGWKFEDLGEGGKDGEGKGGLGHNFARARWARGNCWVTMAIPEFVELLDLQPGDALRTYLLDVLTAQCQALKRLQAESGMWRTLLDVPSSEGSYEEASATAGFAYGMLKAVRKRYIGKEFESVAVKAIRAVLENVSGDGELRKVSFGTAMGKTLQHYKDIKLTSMPYGQAMAIMALGEFLRIFI
jgi:unsaturated rhamnogalacturonyl hydrolase